MLIVDHNKYKTKLKSFNAHLNSVYRHLFKEDVGVHFII